MCNVCVPPPVTAATSTASLKACCIPWTETVFKKINLVLRSQPYFVSCYWICRIIWLFHEQKPCSKHWRVSCRFHKLNQLIEVFCELQKWCEKWAGAVQVSAAERWGSSGGSKLLVARRITSCRCETACAAAIQRVIQLREWVHREPGQGLFSSSAVTA